MYKIDPKYLEEGYRYDYSIPPEKNEIKFHRIIKEIVNKVTFYVGIAPVWNNELQRYVSGKYTISILNAEGVEICSMPKEKFDDIRSQIMHKELEIDNYNRGPVRDQHVKLIERIQMNIFMKPIIENAAENPEIIEHIPVEAFLQKETLAEEILSKYQEIKLNELKNLPVGKDCEPFVEEIKSTVESMNKTFNNIEKTRQTKEGFAELFKRDKEI